MKRALIVIAAAGLLAASCSSEPAQLAGYTRTPAPQAGGLALPDESAGGAPFALRAPQDGLLLIYFGYTSCPDVCPTTLADIRTALADLGDDAAGISLAMVTVDPQRDTPDVLAGYVQSFVPGSHALRTEDDGVLSEVAAVLGAAYDVIEEEDGGVEVVHTAHIYVLDDTGELLVTWPFGIEPEDMVSDLRILQDR